MSRFAGFCLLLIIAGQCGCRVCGGLEQWKCDRLGMCHFGTTPSQAYAYPVGVAAPAYANVPPPEAYPTVAPSAGCSTCRN